MLYKLAGPLAQFGPPAIVATVEDRLFCEVADKGMRAGQGEALRQPTPTSGIRIAFAMLIELARKLFMKGPR
jgi:hypothetical protein